MDNNQSDFEIGDVEGFSHKDNSFSHSILVMSAMRKVLEAGSKEMRTGWYNEKNDNKGNLTKTYIEDTRKVFIESIKTCEMIMSCDFDKHARDHIKKIKSQIENFRNKLIEINDKKWEELPDYLKYNLKKLGEIHIKGRITHPILTTQFIEYELEQYRKIFSELTKLTKRLDFYSAEVFEG